MDRSVDESVDKFVVECVDESALASEGAGPKTAEWFAAERRASAMGCAAGRVRQRKNPLASGLAHSIGGQQGESSHRLGISAGNGNGRLIPCHDGWWLARVANNTALPCTCGRPWVWSHSNRSS